MGWAFRLDLSNHNAYAHEGATRCYHCSPRVRRTSTYAADFLGIHVVIFSGQPRPRAHNGILVSSCRPNFILFTQSSQASGRSSCRGGHLTPGRFLRLLSFPCSRGTIMRDWICAWSRIQRSEYIWRIDCVPGCPDDVGVPNHGNLLRHKMEHVIGPRPHNIAYAVALVTQGLFVSRMLSAYRYWQP